MRLIPHMHIAALALGLTACVSAAPVELPDNHPANPNATAGIVDTGMALADYASAEDFAARAAAEAKAPASGHAGMQHGAMLGMPGMQHRGMDHGAMPGMQHGGAPQGAGKQ
jgi:uncharacterized protein involved in copper resistance